MKIISKKIADLTLDPANVRTHNDKNLQAIKGSLVAFGQQKPIVIDEKGVVIAGNGTLTVAKALGWESIDCVVTKLKGTEKTAFAIADNRTGELAEWDQEGLAKQLSEMMADFDIESIGFDLPEIDEPTEGNIDDDEVPETKENEFNVKRGDIWLLGDHRIMCGDSTCLETVRMLMNGEKADMVFTDPPYGIGYNAQKLNLPNSQKFKDIEGDDQKPNLELIFAFDCLKVVWGANNFPDLLPHRGRWACWDKRSDSIDGAKADRMLGSDFELAWIDKKSGYDKIFRVMHGGVVNKDGGKRVHPTQKPTLLITKCFDEYSAGKNLIVDLFLGSGSTLIACEKTNRKCYGMEIDPHYCSVIIKRWQDFTGKQAVKA